MLTPDYMSYDRQPQSGVPPGGVLVEALIKFASSKSFAATTEARNGENTRSQSDKCYFIIITHVSRRDQVPARYIQVQSTVSKQAFQRQFCTTSMQLSVHPGHCMYALARFLCQTAVKQDEDSRSVHVLWCRCADAVGCWGRQHPGQLAAGSPAGLPGPPWQPLPPHSSLLRQAQQEHRVRVSCAPRSAVQQLPRRRKWPSLWRLPRRCYPLVQTHVLQQDMLMHNIQGFSTNPAVSAQTLLFQHNLCCIFWNSPELEVCKAPIWRLTKLNICPCAVCHQHSCTSMDEANSASRLWECQAGRCCSHSALLLPCVHT